MCEHKVSPDDLSEARRSLTQVFSESDVAQVHSKPSEQPAAYLLACLTYGGCHHPRHKLVIADERKKCQEYLRIYFPMDNTDLLLTAIEAIAMAAPASRRTVPSELVSSGSNPH